MSCLRLLFYQYMILFKRSNATIVLRTIQLKPVKPGEGKLGGENSLDSYIFDLMETHDYENIFFCQEKTLGLKAIIAIHDTTNAINGLYQEA